MPSMKGEVNVPFGWSRTQKPALTINVGPGDFDSTTYKPTDAFVKQVVDDYLVGQGGRPNKDDATPRVAIFRDQNSRIFPTRQALDTFVEQTVREVGTVLANAYPGFVRPITFANSKTLTVRPADESQSFESGMVINRVDGYQTNDASNAYLPPNRKTATYPHYDFFDWPVIGLTYGDNLHIKQDSGIPFLVDAREASKTYEVTPQQAYVVNAFPDTNALPMVPNVFRRFRTHTLSLKDDVYPDLDLSQGHDRLGIVILNRFGEEGQVLHGASRPRVGDPALDPVARRPIVNSAFVTRYPGNTTKGAIYQQPVRTNPHQPQLAY